MLGGRGRQRDIGDIVLGRPGLSCLSVPILVGSEGRGDAEPWNTLGSSLGSFPTLFLPHWDPPSTSQTLPHITYSRGCLCIQDVAHTCGCDPSTPPASSPLQRGPWSVRERKHSTRGLVLLPAGM